MTVKIANGDTMQCDQLVPNLAWWCQGQTFNTTMRVLELGAYDAILGMDWLKQHSPMVTDWKNHCLAFPVNGHMIQLRGVQAPPLDTLKELPVEQLVKWYKGNEVWAMVIVTPEAEAVSDKMASTPVLQLPDFSNQFVVETDACDLGIGAVLMQDQPPLAYLSKPLSATLKHLSIYEKELLALIMAAERWRPYLQWGEFFIKTDHHSLCFLDEQQLQSTLQRKARARVMGLQFKIIYHKGSENFAADSLSHVGHLLAIQVCSEVQPTWLQEVVNFYVTDPEAQRRLTELALASPDAQGNELQQGLIRLRGQVWLGSHSALQTKLSSALHASAVGGHSGIQATYQVQIKWTHWPEDAATWEDWDMLAARFPSVLAWGQASISRGGNVTQDVHRWAPPVSEVALCVC